VFLARAPADSIKHFRHLIRRFFGVAFARALSPREQVWVGKQLSLAEASLFWAQAAVDQRHALTCGRFVQEGRGGPLVINAALLHDVGKTRSDLGIAGRSVAAVLQILKIGGSARMRAYNQHGRIGAADLEAIGASALAVGFARSHQLRGTPEGQDKDTWDLLMQADLSG
jgi:hypothetical protein